VMVTSTSVRSLLASVAVAVSWRCHSTDDLHVARRFCCLAW